MKQFEVLTPDGDNCTVFAETASVEYDAGFLTFHGGTVERVNYFGGTYKTSDIVAAFPPEKWDGFYEVEE